MPWVEVEKEYEFEGPSGRASLLDLFEGRRQLIIYRAFFEPGVSGWPEHACHGCSMMADQVAHVAHLNARDITFAYASRAPQPDIARLKARMGWAMPWYTLTGSWDVDFGVDEYHGTNAFFRDGDRVFRTYFLNNRGDEALGSTWSYLDMSALGRQETWEDSPEGYPQTRAVQLVELARRVRPSRAGPGADEMGHARRLRGRGLGLGSGPGLSLRRLLAPRQQQARACRGSPSPRVVPACPPSLIRPSCTVCLVDPGSVEYPGHRIALIYDEHRIDTVMVR